MATWEEIEAKYHRKAAALQRELAEWLAEQLADGTPATPRFEAHRECTSCKYQHVDSLQDPCATCLEASGEGFSHSKWQAK
jgi:hypothetical protein